MDRPSCELRTRRRPTMIERTERGPSFRPRATPAAIATALAITAAVAVASPAASETAAAGGAFDEYASGPGLGYHDIGGHAQLVRTSDGRSIATVEITGLNPSATYAVHVHAGSCADFAGHYFFAGPVTDG